MRARIAVWEFVDPSLVTNASTLERSSWIVSLGDESEGRKKEYQITPEGREAVRAELRRLHELTQNGDKLTSEWN